MDTPRAAEKRLPPGPTVISAAGLFANAPPLPERSDVSPSLCQGVIRLQSHPGQQRCSTFRVN
jgi:hypothetical protein